MTVTLRRPVQKQCPYRDETDNGTLTIVLPNTDLEVELHALGADIDKLCADPISHEQFTRRLAALLPAGALVTTTWHTGPWSVEVSEGSAA